MEMVLEHLMSFEVRASELEVVLEMAETHLRRQFSTADGLAKTIKSCVLHERAWMVMDKCASLPQISEHLMQSFAQEFRQHLTLEGMATGNITSVEAVEFSRSIWEKLKLGLQSYKYQPQIRATQLPAGDSVCQVASFCWNDSSSVVSNVYQVGPASLRDQTLVELLVYLLEEPCFTILRTQEQLGYAVNCEVSEIFGVLGICISVETHSSKFRLEEVDRRIEHFIDWFYQDMLTWSKRDFFAKVDNFETMQDVVYENLEDEADWEWTEILNQTYVFDRSHIMARLMERVTRTEVLEFWKKFLLKSDHRRKFSVQVAGTATPGQDQGGAVQGRRSVSHLSPSTPRHRARPHRAPEEVLERRDVAKLRYHPVPASYGHAVMNVMTFKSGLDVFPHHKILLPDAAEAERRRDGERKEGEKEKQGEKKTGGSVMSYAKANPGTSGTASA